jgi:hypothetical protein
MSSENVELPVVEGKPVKPPRVLKSMKVWSENKQKYYYRSSSEYYKEFYHKSKHEIVCQYCFAVVNSQLLHHQRGVKCKLQQQDKNSRRKS